MSKYSFIDSIHPDSSHGKILKHIKYGSIVLECGCASGYMTRYMKNHLGCSTYIIEYNQEDFDCAMQFAEDGICADLMGNEWAEKFSDMKFDYILLADVLEHLAQPLEVLKKASSLLKDSGKILISLPNIGHNDILLKLWQGQWDYTQTGLLDDTHIHFWGIGNLPDFFEAADLSVVYLDYTTRKTLQTEQYTASKCPPSDAVLQLLEQRKNGEIYQFVLAVQKKSYVKDHGIAAVSQHEFTNLEGAERFTISEQLREKDQHIANLDSHIAHLNGQLMQRNQELDYIVNSRSWRMTEPIRIAVKKIRKHKYLYLIAKGIKSLIKNGPRATWKKVKRKIRNKIKNKKLANRPLYTAAELKAQKQMKFPRNIKFSILVPLYNTPEKFLREMIQSVQDQTYANWELCLADGSDGEHDNVGEYCRKLAVKDHRISYRKLEKNMGISGNTNACIDMATGDYIALFDHDDLLHPAALYEMMKAICEQNADMIYTDENTFSHTPKDAYCPHFKPDYAPDTLRSYNYICHFTAFSKELLEKAGGGFRSEFDGSQDYDLILRLTEQAEKIVHIPKILYYWRCHANSVASDITAKPYALAAARGALQAHLDRIGLKGKVLDARIPSTYRIAYEIEGTPLVSILIPNKDHIDELKKCLDSVRNKSTYTNWEIIVIENNSTEKETFDYYRNIQKDSRIRVVNWSGEFNYSAINNYGAQFAKGDYILLLNNDIEVITSDWLEQMLMFAQRNDVGAVGAMLYYPDDTIQHAGCILGIGGVAGHAHKYFPRNDYGYMSRLVITQNYSIVTAACLLMSRSAWNAVNGLDVGFAVAFNDVDLCMRIRKAGYLVVWTPYAELYHYESKSRGLEDTPEKQKRFQGEVLRFQSRWTKELESGDPYYNPNLTLEREDFSIK